jgi:peptide/nickel transport system ATP-binding protein
VGTLLVAEKIRKWFPVREGFFASILKQRQSYVRAVDDVSFQIEEGEVFGLVGESGCGKTTTGKTILRLLEPTGGKVQFRDAEVFSLPPKEMKPLRRKMQIIFQDPYESLDPRKRIFDIVAEPLKVHNLCENPEREQEQVAKALQDVDLVPPQDFMDRFPHELSGGQRQRVAVARALILTPAFIVADEPVSMLDVSIRAGILNTMLKLKEHYGISYLFITHDLAVSRHMCNRAAIMYLGKIVEMGHMEELVKEPIHPYSQALVSAVPLPDPTTKRSEMVVRGEVPSAVTPPKGCGFHPRCPFATDVCRKVEPQLSEARSGRQVACHVFA